MQEIIAGRSAWEGGRSGWQSGDPLVRMASGGYCGFSSCFTTSRPTTMALQMFNRPGPRLVDALEFVYALLWDSPEHLPNGFPFEYLHT